MDPSHAPFDAAHQQHMHTNYVASQLSPSYRLRRYLWRAFLSIVGPLVLLGFYAFICFYYLNRQPQNEILRPGSAEANIPFYVWFVVAIFALEWARTALSNFQAAALMLPKYSPPNAMTLFWHADDNWGNPLWWLRAIRNYLCVCLLQSRASRRPDSASYRSTPGRLWAFLSITTLLIFVAIPLSGLTMEPTPALKASKRPAAILGPKASNFNNKGRNSLPSIIEGTWKAGGAATPPDASYFFAPEGSPNVSLTYFEDMSISNPDEGFSAFLGPAVNELVAGTAFGIQTSLHCSLVSGADLRLISFHEWDNYNVTYSGSVSTTVGHGTGGGDYSIVFLNETRGGDLNVPYSFLIAADGAWYGSSPYTSADNIDSQLLDWDSDDGGAQGDPAALLEMYLWQAQTKQDDPVMRALQSDASPLLTKSKTPGNENDPSDSGQPSVGFAVQCRLRTAAGSARLDPMRRTYSGFTVQNATGTGTDSDVYAPQIMSLMALSDFDPVTYQPRQIHEGGMESRWVSLHQGIGEPAREICISECDNPNDPNFGTAVRYVALTPANVTYSLYRLIGQSIIATMGAGSQDPWVGDLYGLQPARWLRPGPVPWMPVLILLAIWTVVTMGVSVWTLFNRRWAPTLSGFELFRFGAQYTDEINAFEAGRFEKCERLRFIPGMVGALPGLAQDGEAGFIGLSGVVADQDGSYVYDRREAAKYTSV